MTTAALHSDDDTPIIMIFQCPPVVFTWNINTFQGGVGRGVAWGLLLSVLSPLVSRKYIIMEA